MDAKDLDLTDYTAADLAHAHTIPARWYTDPRFLELEKRRIFWTTWQPVGRLNRVRRPGDFFTCDLLGEPLVITRGKDEQLRAFYNVCRHRAGPVADGKGNRHSLQCRYHGWTYGLDGLHSRSYDQGRFSVKRENGVHHFQLLLHEFLTGR